MPEARPRQLQLLIVIAATLAWLGSGLIGCGAGETSFEAEEFAELIGNAGAPLELGEILPAADSSIEIRVIELSGGGGGTMLVAGDVGRARNEFTRCEGAVSLVCFRAANIVLRFDELDATQLAQVSEALQTIEAASQDD